MCVLGVMRALKRVYGTRVGSRKSEVRQEWAVVAERSRSDNKKSEGNGQLTLISRIITNRVLCHFERSREIFCLGPKSVSSGQWSLSGGH